MKNYKLLENLVGTKYGDMTGLVEIDGHNNVTELYDLCAEKGISRDDYFILGFGLTDFEIHDFNESRKVMCTVILLETSKYGHTFDDIQKRLKDIPKVDAIKKTFYMNYKDLGKYIKRFDLMLFTSLGNSVKELNIVEE